MSEIAYPDGEFAKIANTIAVRILSLEGKNTDQLKREDYLKAIRQVVLALRGYGP